MGVSDKLGTETPPDPETKRLTLPEALAEFEKKRIAEALQESDGNQRQDARALGITRWMIKRKMKKHGLGRAETR